MIRLFAALPLPEAMADRLEIAALGLPGNVQPRRNLHLTLAFFGEIDEAQAADLHAALSAIRAEAFDWRIDGMGAFGGDRPRSIHAVVRPEPALERLQAKVEQAGRGAGLRMEARRYTPHVTLSRLSAGRTTAPAAAKALAARGALLAGPARAEAFALYRSDLGRGGPEYAALAVYPLADVAAAAQG